MMSMHTSQFFICVITSFASCAYTASSDPKEHLLDTTNDLSGGNWFRKREIANKARFLYEALKKAIEDITQKAHYFVDERLIITQSLEKFYADLALSQEELDRLLKQKVEELEKEKNEQESPQELSDLSEKIASLIQDFALVTQGDKNIHSAVQSSLDVVTTADSYAEKAWDAIKEIDNLLDDVKAQYLCDQIQGYLDHVNQLNTLYIAGTLKSYVIETVGVLTKSMEKIKASKALILPKKEIVKQEPLSAPTVVPSQQNFWSRVVQYLFMPFSWFYRFVIALF